MNFGTKVFDCQGIKEHKNIANTKKVLDAIINYLKLEMCTSGCTICGATYTNWYVINDRATCLCDICYGELNIELQNKSTFLI